MLAIGNGIEGADFSSGDSKMKSGELMPEMGLSSSRRRNHLLDFFLTYHLNQEMLN